MQTTIRISRPTPLLPPELCELLPPTLIGAVENCGAPVAEELRLHAGRACTVTARGKNYTLEWTAEADLPAALLKKICSDSLYAYGESICRGCVTMESGVRVGIAGSAATEGGRIIGVDRITGLIFRIPHRVRVDATHLLPYLAKGGMLLYSPPGVGKTTLLRALTEAASSPEIGLRTVAVDTREELGIGLERPDLTLDILRGYPRAVGIEIAVRSLGASLIVCDEIGNEEDADAILFAAGCGVPILASTHADRRDNLLLRPAMQRLRAARVFSCYVGLSRLPDGRFSYRIEEENDT